MDTTNIIAALDPCANSFADLSSSDTGAPKFSEAWHAQAFGLAMALARARRFTWATWVDTFSAEIRSSPQRAGESNEDAYYRQWESALRQLMLKIGDVDSHDLDETAEHWRRSYLHTEHGRPIVFRRDLPIIDEEDDHGNGHHHSHAELELKASPVFVSKPVNHV